MIMLLTDKALCHLPLSHVLIYNSPPTTMCSNSLESPPPPDKIIFTVPHVGGTHQPLPGRIIFIHSPSHGRGSSLRRCPRHFIPISIHLLYVLVTTYPCLHDIVCYITYDYSCSLPLRVPWYKLIEKGHQALSSFNF